MQNLSGEQNIDMLSSYFTKQDEENFALFNYVNELSNEVEALNEAVQRIQDDIGNYSSDFFHFSLVASKGNNSVEISVRRIMWQDAK